MEKKLFNVECNNILQDFKDCIISKKEALQALNVLYDSVSQSKVDSVSDSSKNTLNGDRDPIEYLKDAFGME